MFELRAVLQKMGGSSEGASTGSSTSTNQNSVATQTLASERFMKAKVGCPTMLTTSRAILKTRPCTDATTSDALDGGNKWLPFACDYTQVSSGLKGAGVCAYDNSPTTSEPILIEAVYCRWEKSVFFLGRYYNKLYDNETEKQKLSKRASGAGYLWQCMVRKAMFTELTFESIQSCTVGKLGTTSLPAIRKSADLWHSIYLSNHAEAANAVVQHGPDPCDYGSQPQRVWFAQYTSKGFLD